MINCCLVVKPRMALLNGCQVGHAPDYSRAMPFLVAENIQLFGLPISYCVNLTQLALIPASSILPTTPAQRFLIPFLEANKNVPLFVLEIT